MPDPLRLLVAADPAAAARAVAAVRAGGPVSPALAPDASVLRIALGAQAWDAVLVLPGGPIPDADLVEAVAGHAVPLVVVSPDRLAAFEPAGARYLRPDALGTLAERLRPSDPAPTHPVAETPPPSAPPCPSPALRGENAAQESTAQESTAQEAAPPEPPSGLDAETLAQHLPVGVYRTTPAGRILYANAALAEILGSPTVEALANVDVRDLCYPRDAFAADIDARGAVQNLVVGWRRADGRRIVTRENARSVRDAAGEVLYYEGTMEDVTAEAEAHAAERRRARTHEAIARFAGVADGAADDAAVYRAAVDAMLAITDARWALLASPTECLAWTEAFPEPLLPAVDQILGRVPMTAQPVLIEDAQETELPWDDATLLGLVRLQDTRGLSCYPLLRSGVPLGALTVGYGEPHVTDDEERRACEALAWHAAGALVRRGAEADLHDSEASLRFIADHTAHVLYRLRYDADGGAPTFDYLSPGIEALTGYAPDALDAAGGLTALTEDREVLEGEGLADHAVEGPGRYRAVYRLRTRAGDPRWVENEAHVWRDEHGQPVGLVGVLQDVTDRKRRADEKADQAQQALARQGALVELGRLDAVGAGAVIDRAADLACAVARVDQASIWIADGPWMTCRAFCAPDRDASLVTPSFPIETFQAFLHTIRGQRVLVVDDVTDDRVDEIGARSFVESFGIRAFLAAPLRQGGDAMGLVVLHRSEEGPAWEAAEVEFAAALADAVVLALERDERGRAEAALRQSEARYRALAELGSDYAFAVHARPDSPGRIAWATDAFARVTGYAADEVGTDRGFLALIEPEHRAEGVAAFDSLGEAGEVSVEVPICTRAGDVRWIAHHARVGEQSPDGTAVVYHSGQDVTDRKRFEAELVAARETAERAREAALELARLKSAFLANMSHEIRTPLTSILGYADVLAEEVEGEHREFVGSIAGNGRRLLDTLNSVLDLAQLDGGGVALDVARLDAAAEVRQAAEALASLASRRGLALAVDAPDPVWARLDAACLGRIVTNLVGNALKFTDAGRVSVAVRAEGRDVRLTVADTGLGIDPDFLPHLFDEFRQETGGERRRHEGSGLGLAITKRLVDLMGGRIDVESARPGGTTFTVWLPAGTPAQDAPAVEALPADAPPLDTPAMGAPSAVPPAWALGCIGHEPAEPAPPAEPAVTADVQASWPQESEPVPDIAPAFEDPFAASPLARGPVGDVQPDPAWDALSTLGPTQTVRPVPAPAPSPVPAGLEEVAVLEAVPVLEVGGDSHAAEAEEPFPQVLPFTPELARLDWAPLGASRSLPPAPEPPAPSVKTAGEFSADPFDFSFLDDTPPATPPSPLASGAPEASPPAMFDFRFGRSQESDPAPPPPERAGPPASAHPHEPAPHAGPPAPRPAEEPVLLVRPAVEAPQEPEDEDDGRPYVLVVEDNGDTRMLLQRILRATYQVTAVGDARSALIAMHKRRFAGLVLDINLGGKETGADVLRIARTLEGYDGVYAIALTAYALPGDRERLLESGFDEYISKPFTRQSLMSALETGIRVA